MGKIEDLFSNVLAELISDTYFSEFKYRKRDHRLIKKNKQGFEAIEFQFWDGYDLKRDERAMVVKPLYLRRFDVLHKWFEQYSFKTLTDQRDNYSIGFEGDMLGKQGQYFFLLDGANFETDILLLKNQLIDISLNVFRQFATLQDLYQYQIEPILQHKGELPIIGASWVFEYLTLCKIVNPEKYDALKVIITKQVQMMNERNEPNITEYYSRLEEIFDELEQRYAN